MFINKIHEEAHLSLKSGKIEEAVVLYSEALILNPGHPDILSDRGVAYLHKNDKDRCFEDFDLALELQPDYAYRYASRAFAKSHFGDLDGAIEDYEKAVELDPDDAVAHNNLGLLYEKMGYFRKAKERFERADKLSKIEDELLKMMNEMENDEPKEVQPPKSNASTDEIESAAQNETQHSSSSELKKIFTSRKQFREFISFMKNGFKIK